ncbi:MAG: cell filamentation protein Fic, partial [bacterium]|nr:cell filamentation protein Fic [bacterium]
ADINNETVWLTQEEMALLFNVDRTRIVRHISNIYLEGELSKDSTCAENAHMGTLGLLFLSMWFIK